MCCSPNSLSSRFDWRRRAHNGQSSNTRRSGFSIPKERSEAERPEAERADQLAP